MLAAWLFITYKLPAQQHRNAWMRATLSLPIGSKFKIDGEFQYRRQNGFDNLNCLDRPLMFSFRNWIHYQYNESVRLSFSPIAYFFHHKIIQQKTDLAADPVKEVRVSAALDLQQKISNKLYIIDRSALEYRIFSNNNTNLTRFRNRLGIKYDLSTRFRSGFYNELLVNLSGNTAYYFFDHNRDVIFLDYTPHPGLRIETGYAYILRLPSNSVEKIKENNVFLNLIFSLK